MHLITLLTVAAAPLAMARHFVIWTDANYRGSWHPEHQGDGGACWNLNGKGDQGSSIGSQHTGCTTFYRERDCRGAQWVQRGSARTVPDFLNDHIWSFKNAC